MNVGWWLRRRVDASKRTSHFAAKKPVGKRNATWNSSVSRRVVLNVGKHGALALSRDGNLRWLSAPKRAKAR